MWTPIQKNTILNVGREWQIDLVEHVVFLCELGGLRSLVLL